MEQLTTGMKSLAIKIRTKVVDICNWIKNKCRKYKKRIIITTVVLAILSLTTATVLASYSYVDSLSQGVLINKTESAIQIGTYRN
jgi:hypothetical protein